ncbi:hypothetical protein Syun_015995 [Stephania yunnanensis]|uniref:Uncharacterized protein n=1 Tax=Stephania yunnanensis TaxID=152371 RepID=A0AAP0J4C0_9MAGN
MEDEKGSRNVPVLPWMRSPIDVGVFDECPLSLLPCLHPGYLFFFFFLPLLCTYLKVPSINCT